MNTARKYWILTIALIVWWVLAWLAGSWMSLAGKDLWILRGGLILIGLAAFITSVWWFRGLDEDRLLQMAEDGTAGGDEIDVLTRKARAHLHAAEPGKDAFCDFPAVLVLGEAGSAKTSIILHGGLEAQLLAGHTGQGSTPVPTPALNLWLAPPFIVAEAGGSLLHEPPRWAHLVKKFAPGGLALMGTGAASPRLALVCIDCERLVTSGAADTLGKSIDQWRARLRETSQLLGINLPVYVLFTRADRIPFFQDFVAPFSNAEASCVLGATTPVAAYTGSSYAAAETATVSAAFDRLFRHLADWRLTLLSRQADANPASPIYEFPREFKKLRSILVPMLVDLCRPSPSHLTPFLRGFYFTGIRPLVVSVPRPAAAIEQLPEQAAAPGELSATRMLDIRKAAAAAKQLIGAAAVETQRIPQWVFLPHLFREVLFQDTTALATSALSTKTGLRNRFLLAAAMGILLVLMAGFTVSSVRNKRLENHLVASAQEVADVHLTGRELPSLEALNSLDALRQSVEALTSYQRQGAPLSMRWGLYVGNALLPDARGIYLQYFHKMLFLKVEEALRQVLSTLPGSPGPNDPYDRAFNALKAYLLTTSDVQRSEREFLTAALLRAWKEGSEVDPARAQLAERQFDFYVRELRAGNPYAAEYDAQLVAHARHYLAQFPEDERVYRSIVAEAEKAIPAINFSRRFPGAADTVADPIEVSGAFTRDGWAFMQSALADPAPYLRAQSWVLGQENPSPQDLAKRADDLRRTYQRDYIARWRSFLRSATVNHPVSLSDASQKLQKLSADQSPLFALFCLAAQNTAIDQPEVGNAFQALQAVAPQDCRDQPAGPPLAGYAKILGDLQVGVDRADSTPSDRKESVKAQCMEDVTLGEEAAKKIAQDFHPDRDAHFDRTVKDLLLAPLESVSILLRPGPVSAAALCAEMSPLEAQFPFRPQTSSDVSVPELAKVFAPAKGALAQFYASALKTLLVSQGARYAANPASRQKVTPSFLSFFNRAIGVQRAMYSSGGEQAQFRFALRPLASENVSSLDLTIDGKNITFSGDTAPFTPLSWPGGSPQGVRLSVKIPGGAGLGFPSYDGTWGLFHFLADATVLRHNGNVYTLEWVLGGDRPVTAPNGKPVAVRFDLDTLGAMPIWEKSFLPTLHCVSVVAQ